MIFTRRFGALAARPNFERIACQDDLDREFHDLLNDEAFEPAPNERAN